MQASGVAVRRPLAAPRRGLAFARRAGRHLWHGPFAPALLFLTATAVFFSGAIAKGWFYAHYDTYTYYVPLACAIDEALAAGRFPLWTPDIFGGHPVFAESEAAMLYPFNLAAWLLLPADTALIALRVLRFLLAGLFTYAFGRAIGLSRSAATLAGLSFAFGSFHVGQIHHTNLADAAIWLPLVLSLVERGLRATGVRRFRFWLLGGLAFAAQLLTIHVNPVLMSLMLLTVYVVARVTFLGPLIPEASATRVGSQPGSPIPLWRRIGAGRAVHTFSLWERVGVRVVPGVAAIALVVAVGLGVAAAQLLPLYELSTFSFRGRPVTYGFATSFALPPENLLTLLFPFFFRDSSGYWSPWFRYDTTVYGGVVPLLLGTLALVLAFAQGVRAPSAGRSLAEPLAQDGLKRERLEPFVPAGWVAFFGGVFGASLLLALGDYSPVKLYGLVWQLPVFSSTRVPARYLFVTLFALAMLAGFGLLGLERLLSSPAPASGGNPPPGGNGVRALRRLRWALLVMTGLGLATLATFVRVREWATADSEAARAALLAPYLALRGPNLEPQKARDPFGALLASLDPLSPWTERSFVCLGLGLLLLWGWYLLRRPARFFRLGLVLLTTADLLLFARDLHARVPLESVVKAGPAVHFLLEHRSGLDRVDTLWPVWETQPNRLLPWKIAEANGYSSLLPDRHGAYMEQANRFDNRLLDVMGVRYVIAHRAYIPWRLAAQQPVFEDAEVAIYERPATLPRTLVVPRARLAADPAEALRQMVRSDFDPVQEVVVEDRAAIAWGDGAAGWRRPGRVDVVEYGSERVVARATADQPSYLFLADTYYPGWRAFVDGAERPVYRADYLFRAVPLPAGEHTVEFIFDPLSLKAGAALSALSLVAVVVGLAATLIGRPDPPRRRGGPSRSKPSALGSPSRRETGQALTRQEA